MSTKPAAAHSCYAVFWSVLEESLARARDHLRTTTKLEVTKSFDRLRAGLLNVAHADPAYPELSMAIGTASAEVQGQADAIAEWFHRPEGRQGLHSYSLKQATEIAVASAMNALRSFTPEIANNVTAGYSVQPNGLVLITELIWVALENVRIHSGVERAPWIVIEGDIDPESAVLSLRIRSEVALGERTNAREAELEKLRKVILAGTFKDRVRKEGNSGFLKIASVVMQANRGRLEFGFDGDREFFVSVDLPSIVLDDRAIASE